jgi:uncharacterized membrane protein YdbT with pleckstrin-like domain
VNPFGVFMISLIIQYVVAAASRMNKLLNFQDDEIHLFIERGLLQLLNDIYICK